MVTEAAVTAVTVVIVVTEAAPAPAPARVTTGVRAKALMTAVVTRPAVIRAEGARTSEGSATRPSA